MGYFVGNRLYLELVDSDFILHLVVWSDGVWRRLIHFTSHHEWAERLLHLHVNT
jgi:hypothetical protein